MFKVYEYVLEKKNIIINNNSYSIVTLNDIWFLKILYLIKYVIQFDSWNSCNTLTVDDIRKYEYCSEHF